MKLTAQNRVYRFLKSLPGCLTLACVGLTFGMVSVYGDRLADLSVPLGYNANQSLSGSSPELWRLDLDPLLDQNFYNQVDLFPSLSAISRFSTEKSLSSNRLDSPEGFDSRSIPTTGNQFSFSIIRSLLNFTGGRVVLVSNLWFIGSTFLSAILAVFLLRKLDVDPLLAVLGSLVISCNPSTFGKEPFAVLSNQGILLTTAFVLLLLLGRPLSPWVFGSVLILNATSGIYAYVFTSILFVLALLFNNLPRQKLKELAIAALASITVGGAIIGLNLYTSFQYWKSLGSVRIARTGAELMSWPARLVDAWVLPAYSIFDWRGFNRESFLAGFPLGETVYAYGPYGLVALCSAIWVLRSRNLLCQSPWQPVLEASCLVLIGLHLLLPIGGISSFLLPWFPIVIKSWERMQVGVAIVSIFFLCVLGSTAKKFQRKFTFVLVVVSLTVGLFGALPIGPFHNADHAQSRWGSVESFMKRVEARFPNSKVFWLPVQGGFEAGPWGDVPPYSDLLGPTLTTTIRFSSRLVKPVESSEFLNEQFSIRDRPQNTLLRVIQEGFDSIIVDVRAATDEFIAGLQFSICEAKISDIRGQYVYCRIRKNGVFKSEGLYVGEQHIKNWAID
jgi:hypothetical protein